MKVKELASGRKIVTTGYAARALGTSARTVCKMVDRKLLEGYRVPGSHDRRIFLDSLDGKMRELGIAAAAKPLVWLCTGREREDALCAKFAGLARTEHVRDFANALGHMAEERPAAAVVDAPWLGRNEAVMLARGLQCGNTPAPVVLIACDDEADPQQWADANTLVVQDCQLDPTRAVEWIVDKVTKKAAPQPLAKRRGRSPATRPKTAGAA